MIQVLSTFVSKPLERPTSVVSSASPSAPTPSCRALCLQSIIYHHLITSPSQARFAMPPATRTTVSLSLGTDEHHSQERSFETSKRRTALQPNRNEPKSEEGQALETPKSKLRRPPVLSAAGWKVSLIDVPAASVCDTSVGSSCAGSAGLLRAECP